MIDITPQTDSNTQVTVGDKIRVRWVLNAQADPKDMTFTLNEKQFSGTDITESLVERGEDRLWRYSVTTTLKTPFTQVEIDLSDPVNDATDTAYINANNRLS